MTNPITKGRIFTFIAAGIMAALSILNIERAPETMPEAFICATWANAAIMGCAMLMCASESLYRSRLCGFFMLVGFALAAGKLLIVVIGSCAGLFMEKVLSGWPLLAAAGIFLGCVAALALCFLPFRVDGRGGYKGLICYSLVFAASWFLMGAGSSGFAWFVLGITILAVVWPRGALAYCLALVGVGAAVGGAAVGAGALGGMSVWNKN